MNNQLSNELTQKLNLETNLSVRQLQSLNFLVAPLLELQHNITTELENNPLLEAEIPAEELVGDIVNQSASEATRPEELHQEDENDFSELISAIEETTPEIRNNDSDDNTELAEQNEYRFNSITEELSLQDFLLEQLNFSDEPENIRKIGEYIIGSIDDCGRLITPDGDIIMAMQCTQTEYLKALDLVQSFDPPGIGGRSLAETLRLEVLRNDPDNQKLLDIINLYLEDIASNRLPQVAKAMDISLDELNDCIVELKHLDPCPGKKFQNNAQFYIVPEFTVIRQGDELIIEGNDSYLPQLHISKKYLSILEDPATDAETKSYLKQKLISANNLFHNIEARQSTLRKITEVLIQRQREFFFHGVNALKPLTMQQVAAEVNLHETTISRAVVNKYLRTEFGIFEYRFFFTSGIANADGDELSSRAVKEKIKTLIADENPCKPLSDDKIAAILQEDGMKIARRTVAKYREALNIPPTNLRRKHQ